MGAEGTTDWHHAAASALEWWRDAGVDVLVDDAPRDWMARSPIAVAEPVVPEAAAAPALPDTLEAFVEWRLSDAAPEAGWFAPRVGPSGDPGAPLMIVTDMPDPEDGAAGALFSGDKGRLFDRILAAIGTSRSEVHIASIAVAHPVTGRIPKEAVPRLRELMLYYIGLVDPARMLLFGRATEQILNPADSDARNIEFAIRHQRGESGAIWCDHPRFLMGKPAAKAEAWRRLQHFLPGGNGPCV